MYDYSNITPRSLPWVFISFREPNANKNWIKLKSLVPEAYRSHGVVGFDAAHRAAAAKLKNEYFFTLDGDSEVDENWLDSPLHIKLQPHMAWCWRSRNKINKLSYGNGGVKLWHRSVIENMNCHENGVDFCWLNNYISLGQIAGTTDPGSSELQAFIAGAREGIKLLLSSGNPVPVEKLPLEWNMYNRSCWLVWCTRGAQDKIHRWAPFGARYSAYKFLTNEWHHTIINDWHFLKNEFDKINDSFESLNSFLSNFTQENYEMQWRYVFEKLGKNLEKLLHVKLPNMYDCLDWDWLDSCYTHHLT